MSGIPFRCDPAHTALVVVDVQNDFCSPEGALARAGFDTRAAQQMVPRLARLLAAARAVRVPVVHVRTVHDESTDSPQWLGRVGHGPGTERTGITCRTGSWGAGFYGVAPQAPEVVVTKNRFSAFVGTNLDLVLRTRGVRSVLFAGVTTETCVESSLRDGLFHEYWVSLVEDCAASYRPEFHRASVEIVAANFGTVLTGPELAGHWRDRPAAVP